jgi:hypothetical protein
VQQRRDSKMVNWQHNGSVAEWSIAPVLKTGKGKPFVSSNLTASARNTKKYNKYQIFSYFLSSQLTIQLSN